MQQWTPDQLYQNLEDGNSIFLKLSKPGCGVCKLSQPAVRRIEEAYAKDYLFAEINAEEFPEILEVADTEVLPVFFLFKNKSLKGKFIGFKGQAKLQEFVESSSVS